MFCDYLAFIHVMLFVADDLIVLMAFAGKQYYIICPMVVNRPFYRLGAVAYRNMLRFLSLESDEYLVYYLLRLLGAGIIARYDNKIGIIGRYGAHYGPLCSVTVAAAAEENNNPPCVLSSQCL